MTANSLQSGRKERADVIAEDKDGQVVLIVEIKGMHNTGNPGIRQTLAYLNNSDALFGMFADFDNIQIFPKGQRTPENPILQLKTLDVLSFYEPRFGDKRISGEYFTALIEAWLRDFAFHWKSDQPPACEEMKAIGLAGRLAGGMTRNEEVHADLPLY